MVPGDLNEVSMSDFYQLVGMARVSRKMLQEDQETAILQAVSKILEGLNE